MLSRCAQSVLSSIDLRVVVLGSDSAGYFLAVALSVLVFEPDVLVRDEILTASESALMHDLPSDDTGPVGHGRCTEFTCDAVDHRRKDDSQTRDIRSATSK